MRAEEFLTGQLAVLIDERFCGRRDAYAVRRKRPDSSGKYPYNPARTPEGDDLCLTPAVLEEHINGETTVGMYLHEKGGNSVCVGVFDLDSHGGATSWGEMLTKSAELQTALSKHSLQSARFRSRGGNGVHIWLLFDSPVNAASLRAFMQGVLAETGLREGSDGGLAVGVCEIFPKQDKVATNGYGNLVALPLSGKSAPINDKGEILKPDRWLSFFHGLPINQTKLIPVLPEGKKNPVGRPKKSTTLDTHPLEACAFVQHCRDNATTLSEPQWQAFASNCGVVEGGKGLFHEISRLDHTRYNTDEAEAKFCRAEKAKAPYRCVTIGKEGFICPHMNTSGKCDIHKGRAPAVFAQEPKAKIQFFKRLEKVAEAAKQESISKVALDDLRNKGHFYRTRGEGRLLYFKEDEMRLYDLQGSDFKALFNEIYGINGSTKLWSYCLEDLLAYCARQGDITDTFLFSRWENGKLYIDQGDQKVLRLNGETTETVSNGADGILFEDSGVEHIAASESLEHPILRELLIDGLNMKESAFKDLLEAYIYCLFFESLLPTKPILLMNGVKGGGKTSSLRAIKKALFGELSDVSTGFTKSEGDAIAAITHNHFLIADNVDGMVPWLGNLMASISTGTDISMRKLYKTNELSTYRPRCFVAITSRDPLSFKRDDLADRLFMIDLERRKEFIPESELHQRICVNRSAIWAEVLPNLNKIITRINEGGLPTSSSHRLADWARLVSVIGEALELPRVQEGLDLLAKSRREFVLEGNAIYEGISAWVAHGKWKNDDGSSRRVSTGELHAEIKLLYMNGQGYDSAEGHTSAALSYHGATSKYPIDSPRKFGVELANTLNELASYFDITCEEGRARKKYVTIKPSTEAETYAA